MLNRILYALLLCLSIESCAPNLPSAPDLFVDFEFIESPITPLTQASRNLMSGVYEVVKGKDIFGDIVVGKWIGIRWCLFSQHDAVYSENAGGVSGGLIKMSGYIRIVRSGIGTRIRLSVDSTNGAKELIAETTPSQVRILGKTAEGKSIELRRLRNLYSPAPPDTTLEIIAHRGGGRNSDRLGISENSIPMIQHAVSLGATGIEIDVKRTRDSEIIVFHDDSFSPRTVQGVYLLGKVEDFDLEQIKLFGRLINGETIPTLSEALMFVIDNTPLSFVWLDVKDPASVDLVIQIQKFAVDYALTQGRILNIYLGIPSQETLNAYINSPLKDSTDVLVELDAETAIALPTCRVWAPVWTRNITAEDVTRMHAANRRVFTWTVDLRETIIDYLDRVDGILSNYPTLVAGIHYSQE